VPNDSLPLVHDGDGLSIELEVHEKHVRIRYILRYIGNTNVQPSAENFMDLDHVTRRSIVAQINKRYTGYMIHAQ